MLKRHHFVCLAGEALALAVELSATSAARLHKVATETAGMGAPARSPAAAGGLPAAADKESNSVPLPEQMTAAAAKPQGSPKGDAGEQANPKEGAAQPDQAATKQGKACSCCSVM